MNEHLVSVKNNSRAEHWNLEDGYNKSIPFDPETYPYRVFRPGSRYGLFVVLRMFEQNMDYVCRGPVQGFKIILHPPDEVPQVSTNFIRVPTLQEAIVFVKPNVITTSEGLRTYEPNQRQCFFDFERDLKFLKVYTQRSCELECLSNFTKPQPHSCQVFNATLVNLEQDFLGNLLKKNPASKARTKNVQRQHARKHCDSEERL